VRVNYIVIGDTVYETENENVESEGVMRDSACQTGFLQSEFLNCNGFIQFSESGGDA